jgi:type 1 fimbriae regulatory protein FimB/type 1 fimbriae regulatory protein FimE
MSKISYLREPATHAPTIENRKVLPNSPKYNKVREREYLLPNEVNLIMKAAKNTGRHGHRDMMILMMSYRHALSVSELVKRAGNEGH